MIAFMNEELLEIREYTGEGFQPLVYFGTWRVAVLNYIEDLHPAKIDSLERHPETDEVFVLMRGLGILFLGEGEPQVENLVSQVMEKGKIYNVKPHTWHTIVLSRDASVLIVENGDTCEDKSEYILLKPEHSRFILTCAQNEHPGKWGN
jgi:ureidoglycolate hydrolase